MYVCVCVRVCVRVVSLAFSLERELRQWQDAEQRLQGARATASEFTGPTELLTFVLPADYSALNNLNLLSESASDSADKQASDALGQLYFKAGQLLSKVNEIRDLNAYATEYYGTITARVHDATFEKLGDVDNPKKLIESLASSKPLV
jgi:hypothetical protein